MKVTEAIICAPGAFMVSKMPARAAGMTPVSRVQHMNSISLRLQRARRSGRVQANTVIGRATSDIQPGCHVHTHNLAFEELQFDYEFPSGETALPARRPERPPPERGAP